MALPSDKSLLVGLGLAAGVFAIHQNLTPSLADVRVADPEDRDVDSSERTATMIGSALVTAVALMARDATVFIIGETVVLAMSWTYKHANTVDPRTGTVNPPQVPASPEADAIMDEGVVAYES